MSDKIEVNKSTCKKLLKASGSNVSKESITEFQTQLSDFGTKISKKASDLAIGAKRKTIKVKDVTDAFNESIDMDESETEEADTEDVDEETTED